MGGYVPDPTNPEHVAISPTGRLAFGVSVGPARTDGSAPTIAELDAMVHVGWVDAAELRLDNPDVYGMCTACGSVEVRLDEATGTRDLSGIGESAEYPTGYGCEVCS